MDLILANTRIPESLRGDLEALATGVRVAERRLHKLIEKYGVEALRESMENKILDGRRIAMNRLKTLPKRGILF